VVASQLAPAWMGKRVLWYQLWDLKKLCWSFDWMLQPSSGCLLMAEAFNRNVGEVFSNLKVGYQRSLFSVHKYSRGKEKRICSRCIHPDVCLYVMGLNWYTESAVLATSMSSSAHCTAYIIQATAIKESTKSAHRVKLDVTLRAPLVVLPYRTKTTEGEIYIDLGDFQLSNE